MLIWLLAVAGTTLTPVTLAQDTTASTAAPPVVARDTLVVRVVEMGTEWELFIAVVAVLAAVAGTVFAGWQARLARKTLETSVEAAVTCTVDMTTNNGNGPGFRLHNAGPGKARITEFTICVDGVVTTNRAKGGWVDALSQLRLTESDFRKCWYPPNGYVAAGETDVLLAYQGSNWAVDEATIRKALRRLTIKVKYEDSLERPQCHTLVASEVISEV